MKNKGIIYVLSILLAILLLGGCSVVGTYNGLVSEQTKVEQAQADVATALQRRSDLIGNRGLYPNRRSASKNWNWISHL